LNQEEVLYLRFNRLKMPEEIKRQTAYKVRIKELLENPYKKEEGEWEPNYVDLGDRKVSRVNIMGVVVSRNENEPKSVLIDDGSDKISIKPFGNDDLIASLNVGEMVLVVGRPREFNSERYVIPEMIKKIADKKWFDLRKIELGENATNKELIQKNRNSAQETEVIVEETKENVHNKIINKIKELDSNEGVDSGDIINVFGTDSEKIINNLLENGEIFEIKPGRLKVLE